MVDISGVVGYARYSCRVTATTFFELVMARNWHWQSPA
jgi:hypothetical protein